MDILENTLNPLIPDIAVTNSNEFDICNCTFSQTQAVKLSVPLGSVIGPLLFLLYVNELPQYLEDVHLTIYADEEYVDQQVIKLEVVINKFLLGVKETS